MLVKAAREDLHVLFADALAHQHDLKRGHS